MRKGLRVAGPTSGVGVDRHFEPRWAVTGRIMTSTSCLCPGCGRGSRFLWRGLAGLARLGETGSGPKDSASSPKSDQ